MVLDLHKLRGIVIAVEMAWVWERGEKGK